MKIVACIIRKNNLDVQESSTLGKMINPGVYTKFVHGLRAECLITTICSRQAFCMKIHIIVFFSYILRCTRWWWYLLYILRFDIRHNSIRLYIMNGNILPLTVNWCSFFNWIQKLIFNISNYFEVQLGKMAVCESCSAFRLHLSLPVGLNLSLWRQRIHWSFLCVRAAFSTSLLNPISHQASVSTVILLLFYWYFISDSRRYNF